MTPRLNQKEISNLPQGLTWAGYDRSALTAGILHIGVGNFHRAHMAHYLDRLLELGTATDWGIVGAGITAADEKTRERLKPQDWLTVVMELEPKAGSARIVGSMVDFLPVDPGAILQALRNPAIRIVSMTLTEGGYFLDPASGQFDPEHPGMRMDAKTPHAPRTVFGILAESLRLRREAGDPSFTIMSCDNLPGNGAVAQTTLTGLTRLYDAGLSDWISENTAFPNAMVDCITPATTEHERAAVRDTFGIEDAALVVCEPFRQWVIEDRFSCGRPPLERVGVEFVPDVASHELMKLRILNAGHAALAYAASLLGHRFVHTAMEDEDIVAWLHALHTRETIPTLPVLQGIDYENYLALVLERFANPKIGDMVQRLAAEGADRQPKFILPTLRDALDMQVPIEGLSLEVALWAHYCQVLLETGQQSALQDAQADRLIEFAGASIRQSSAFLENRHVFGTLAQNTRFSETFSKWLATLREVGTRAALRKFIAM